MPKKPITNNFSSHPIIFITTIKKRFGNAHWIRTKYYSHQFKNKVILAFHDQDDNTIKQIYFSKNQIIKPIKEIPLKNLYPFIISLHPTLIVFDLREIVGNFLTNIYQLNCPMVIFDSQETDHIEKINYVINPLPLLEDFSANLKGIKYLQVDNFTTTKNLEKNIVFYVGTIDNPHYFRSSFKSIKKIVEKNIELKNKNLIVIIENIQLPFLKIFVKTYLKNIPVLFKQRLPSFNSLIKLNPILFISHFGISFLEALKNKVRVIVLSPTKYHRKLIQEHFPQLLYPSTPTLTSISKSNQPYHKGSLIGKQEKLIFPILKQLSKNKKILSCPLCFSEKIKIVHRENWFNLKKCLKCKLIWQEDLGLKKIFNLKNKTYSKDYFFQEYKNQYGKTYLEDKANINQLNAQRLKIIQRFYPNQPQMKLLDVGCALGFFLDLAKEKGLSTLGNDISTYTAKQIKRHKFFKGNFLSLNLKEKLDIITLWNVIEHFPDFRELFKKIATSQEKGGLLAFSTPNSSGLSGYFRKQEFLKNSPSDHFFIFNLFNLKKILKQHGYQLLKVKPTGIHFERFKKTFPWISVIIRKKLYRFLANWFNLGDTFEIYSRKMK